MDRERRVRSLMDWCRRDPQMGHAQLEREEEDVAQEVRERLRRGPQFAPTVWEAFRVIRAERARMRGRQ